MTRGLKRRYGRDELHFLTFSCHQRREFLIENRARDLFASELARARREYGFRLVGYVVMPNHVHLLVGEPKKGTVSTVLQMLKQRVARKMRKGREGQVGSAPAYDERKASAFWQARFYDFNVYSREKMNEKLNYIHANPVVRRLVDHPRDWMWSSWSNYVDGTGLIEVDVM